MRHTTPALKTMKFASLCDTLTARAAAQVVRLALLYALWDRNDRIDVPHLKAAMAVWEYCASSVEYIFGETLGDTTADAILAALRQAPNGLTRTEISGIFSRNVPANQVARALAELVRHRLAVHRKNEAPGTGRPAEIWHAIQMGE